jgi:AcrR family transcriptional regulator
VGTIDRPASRPESEPRDDILKAAESCFEYFGFRKTTVDDIAKSAGISRTTVYRFFKDRDALLGALILSHGEDLMSATRAHVEQFSSFEDILVEGMLFQIEYGHKDLFWQLLVSPDYMDIANRLIISSSAALALTTPLWEPLIAAGQERREVKADLDVHDGCRWIVLVNVIAFSRNDLVPDDTDGLRAWIRQFVLPPFTIGVSGKQPARSHRRPSKVIARNAHRSTP